MKVIPSLCFTMLSVSGQRRAHWLLIRVRLFSHHLLYSFVWLTAYIISLDYLHVVVHLHPFAAVRFKHILSPVRKVLTKCVINIHGLMVCCTKSVVSAAAQHISFLLYHRFFDPTRFTSLRGTFILNSPQKTIRGILWLYERQRGKNVREKRLFLSQSAAVEVLTWSKWGKNDGKKTEVSRQTGDNKRKKESVVDE